MDLKEIMEYDNFVVVGNTIVEDKYAYKIKYALKDKNYNVECVDKELTSINDIDMDLDIINLCVHPAKGIKYLKENTKKAKCVLIQPGAESEEIINYLKETGQDYFEGCVLVGLSLYSR
jgi:predicted CoA-binding protein